MQIQNENFEFVEDVNFEFNDPLKNNGGKYLLNFDDSCGEICNSKAFVDTSIAGKHRGFSVFYILHQLFHQSKLGRDVELKYTHIVLFNYPRHKMKISTLSAQMGLRSELVVTGIETQRQFPTVTFWLTCRCVQTIGYVIVLTVVASHPKFKLPDRLKHLKFLDDEHKIFFYSPSVPILSQNCKTIFFHSCPKAFIRFLCECRVNLHKGNLQSIKRHHVAKFQSEVQLFPLKTTTWKQRRDFLATEKGFQPMEVNNPPINSHFSWYGAVCSCPSFYVQQKEFECSPSYEAGTTKVSSWPKSSVPNWLVKKRNNQNSFAKADSSEDKILLFPRIKFSNSQS